MMRNGNQVETSLAKMGHSQTCSLSILKRKRYYCIYTSKMGNNLLIREDGNRRRWSIVQQVDVSRTYSGTALLAVVYVVEKLHSVSRIF